METPINEKPQTFTQEDIDKLKAEADARYEALREEGAARIAELKGSVSADAFLKSEQVKTNALEAENAQLSKYFGVGSNGKLANDLARENPVLYESLKAKAQKNGLIGRPLALPITGRKAFGPI